MRQQRDGAHPPDDSMRTLVWFRGKDLRLADHAPLRSALTQGEVLPLFVLDPYFFTKARAQQLPHRWPKASFTIAPE